jgi:hypothetical protein
MCGVPVFKFAEHASELNSITMKMGRQQIPPKHWKKHYGA